MDITRRCDYACRIMRAVCKADGKRVTVADIAESEKIPYSFARTIQHDLVKAGLLNTVRGAHGGVVLAKRPEEITLLQIIEVVEGPLAISRCSRSTDECEFCDSCEYHMVWLAADILLRDYFKSIALSDLFVNTSRRNYGK